MEDFKIRKSGRAARQESHKRQMRQHGRSIGEVHRAVVEKNVKQVTA